MRARGDRQGAAAGCPPRGPGERRRGATARSARALGRLALAAAALAAAACSSVTVTPEVAIRSVPRQPLVGRLIYSGERQYVPRALRPSEDAPGVFVYSVSEISSRGPMLLLGEIYPLSLLGFPTQQTVVTAGATLEVRNARGPIAIYRANARARVFRSRYGSDQTAELTRRARIALRDNLDAQLINDLPSLAQQLAR